MFRSALFTLAAMLSPVGANAQTHAPITDTPPLPGVVQGCGFYTILGAARSLDGAFAIQDSLGAIGSGAHDNANIPQFRNGYYSVTYGPFATQALATAKAAEWKGRVPDAYTKFGCYEDLQDRAAALPISRGVYVRDGATCDRPPNTAVRVYDGTGISGSATRECTFKVSDRQGALFGGTNICTDTYDGNPNAAALSVRVLSADRFRLAENGRIVGDYRLCRR